MMYRFALHLSALLALGLSFGATQAQNQVTAEAWTVGMMETLPDFFCQDDQYFMQCFEVTQSECQTVARQEAQRCLAEFADQLPARLTMPNDGREWGTEVGRCAGIGYDLQLAKRKLAAPRCNAPG